MAINLTISQYRDLSEQAAKRIRALEVAIARHQEASAALAAAEDREAETAAAVTEAQAEADAYAEALRDALIAATEE